MSATDSSSNETNRRTRISRTGFTSSDRMIHRIRRHDARGTSSSSIRKKRGQKTYSEQRPFVPRMTTDPIHSPDDLASQNQADRMSLDPIDLSDEEIQVLRDSHSERKSRYTRTDVLSNFVEQGDGYRCKICQRVSYQSRKLVMVEDIDLIVSGLQI